MSLNCCIVDADAANRQEMAHFLAQHGAAPVTQLQRIDQLPAVLNSADPPRLVVVHIDPNPADQLGRIEPLIRSHPNSE